jgi:hypothetical protein
MPLPNLHVADVCKLGKGMHELSMQIADFLGKNVSLRE